MDRAATVSPVARWARAAPATLVVLLRSIPLRLMLWSRLSRRRFERQLEDAVELAGPVGSLAGILEATDRGVYRHSLRVARHAAAIARGLGLSRRRVARIHAAAILHDIGKTRTPTTILAKADPLTEQEYLILKEHAETGAAMVTMLGDPELTRIVRHHHERIDGAGYPAGLAGESIPLGARIVAVADVFDALTSERPYHAAMAPDEALALLGAEAGAQLDPRVVDLFRRYYAGRPAAASRQPSRGLVGRLRFAGPLAAVPMAAAAALVLIGGTAPSVAPTLAHAPARIQVKPGPTHAHFVRGGAVPAPQAAGHSSATAAFAALSQGDGSGSGGSASIGPSPSGAGHRGAAQLDGAESGAAVHQASGPDPEASSEPAPAVEPATEPASAPGTEPESAPASEPASVPVAPVPAGTVPAGSQGLETGGVTEPPPAAPENEPEPEPTAPTLPAAPSTPAPELHWHQGLRYQWHWHEGPEQTEQSTGSTSSPADQADGGLTEAPSN
jgi:putative nucleotidyltransferase with HDIG domain